MSKNTPSVIYLHPLLSLYAQVANVKRFQWTYPAWNARFRGWIGKPTNGPHLFSNYTPNFL